VNEGHLKRSFTGAHDRQGREPEQVQMEARARKGPWLAKVAGQYYRQVEVQKAVATDGKVLTPMAGDSVVAGLLRRRKTKPWAEFILGRLYEEGCGVERDPRRAFRYYLNAARRGNTHATYFVASCYFMGLGTDQDNRRAADWFEKAAAQGDRDAVYMYALCLQSGVGRRKDAVTARRLMKLAAAMGESVATEQLGLSHGASGRPRPWLTTAIRGRAPQGSDRANPGRKRSRREPPNRLPSSGGGD
jgi:TPR repeat protein